MCVSVSVSVCLKGGRVGKPDKRLIFKIYKKLDIKVPNIPVKKWSKELSREFSIEESQMTKRYIRKCSTSLAIRGCKSK